MRVSQVVLAARRQTGSGNRGELGLPRAGPHLDRGMCFSDKRTCARRFTRYSSFLFLLVYTFPKFLFFTWWLPAGAILRRMRALPPTGSLDGSRASASGTNPASEKVSGVGEQPHQGSPGAGLAPWLCLSCRCTRYQLPRQLALGLIGAGRGRAQPGGAALGLSGARVTFPGRTLAPDTQQRSSAEDSTGVHILP